MPGCGWPALRPSDGIAKKTRSDFFACGLAAAEYWHLARPKAVGAKPVGPNL